jgi:hypothetical protein
VYEARPEISDQVTSDLKDGIGPSKASICGSVTGLC